MFTLVILLKKSKEQRYQSQVVVSRYMLTTAPTGNLPFRPHR